MLSEARLRLGLPVGGLGLPLHFFANIGSTNDVALELARQGAEHGTLVVAEAQTAGRGRAGNRWWTAPGSSLALSLVLRPRGLAPAQANVLHALGALAVCEALQGEGLEPQIKWPNDVLLTGRKMAGILVEAGVQQDELQYAVLGVGINVREGSVPDGWPLAFPATHLEAVLGRAVDRSELSIAVVKGVARWLPALAGLEMLRAWEGRMAFRGQWVEVGVPDRMVCGRVRGIAPSGGLRLEGSDGEVIEVTTTTGHLRPLDESHAQGTGSGG